MSRRHHCPPPPLPSGYQQLNYIQATGTQWIDIGYKPNNRTYYYLDFQSTKTDIGGNNFGVVRWSGANTYDTFAISDAASTDYKILFYYGRYSYNQYAKLGQNSSTFLGQRHNGYIDGINKICNLDNTYYATIGNYSYQSSYNMVLFGFNNMGNINADGYLKVFECIINDNNIPQRHYIPALRISDYKVGLYDLCGSICPLTNTPFYINAGSGDFLYG